MLRLFGIRLRWTSLITEYDPPHLFVDEQVKGPYASWRHRHTFTPQAMAVIARDEVTYALPFGVAGRLIQWICVRWALGAIFNYREKMVRELLVDKAMCVIPVLGGIDDQGLPRIRIRAGAQAGRWG